MANARTNASTEELQLAVADIRDELSQVTDPFERTLLLESLRATEDVIRHREFIARHAATWVTTSAPDGRDGWQVIARERVTAVGTDLDSAELSAHDLGCEPGTVYKVALLDDEDREMRSVEIAAR